VSAVTGGQNGGIGYVGIFDASNIPGSQNTIILPVGSIGIIDDPSAGSHSYSIKVYVSNAAAVLSSLGTIKMQVMEL